MAALSSGGVWLAVAGVVVMLAVSGCVALALLAKVLAAPKRDVRVRVQVVPWPRIEIDVKAGSGDSAERRRRP